MLELDDVACSRQELDWYLQQNVVPSCVEGFVQTLRVARLDPAGAVIWRLAEDPSEIPAPQLVPCTQLLDNKTFLAAEILGTADSDELIDFPVK